MFFLIKMYNKYRRHVKNRLKMYITVRLMLSKTIAKGAKGVTDGQYKLGKIFLCGT